MSNTKELLLLHLAHTRQALARAKNNSYSDLRKQEYQDQLFRLFNAIDGDILSRLNSLTDFQIYDGPKRHLGFILKSLEFLDSSTLNQIPYEIVECLNQAMGEWESPDKFIIVTSLINNVQDFSFDGWIAFADDLYNDIETRYSLTFKHRLVQINLPRAFSRDYLATVVLYHELGHFIDSRFSIMQSLINEVLDSIFLDKYTTNELKEIEEYFPELSEYIIKTPRKYWYSPFGFPFVITLNHFQEYYCDLFAAQYVGETSSIYVTYLSEANSTFYATHPATTHRAKVVSDFVSGTRNIVVDLINTAINRVNKTTLRKRYTDVPDTDFFNLVPPVLTDKKELHGIFSSAWNLWLKNQNKLSSQLNTTELSKIYNAVNSLVEKSIGNFITVNEWSKAETIVALPVLTTSWNIFHRRRNGVLVKKDILELLHNKILHIRPLLSADQIGESGIDFRLGYDFLVSIQGREAFINASKNEWNSGEQQRNVNQFFQPSRRQLGETFILHPRQTVLAVSLEYVKLPDDCLLMLFMRSSYSRLGMTISTIVQPGYCGCLSLEFTNNNNNPINLSVGARVIQGILVRVSNPTQYFHASRKYICQIRPEPSAVINDPDLVTLNKLWKLNNLRPSS